MTSVYFFSAVFLYFLYMFCIFFYSFHLDAPTTSPTPTTNPVNTQGTVRPHLLSLSRVCASVSARVSGLSGRGGTRTCTRGQVGPRDGEFQSDSTADR